MGTGGGHPGSDVQSQKVLTPVYRPTTGPEKPVNSLLGLDFSFVLLGQNLPGL